MSVNCSKGFWQLKPETGEIFSPDGRLPLATVSGLSFPDKDIEECISNAAVMSQAADMYSLLIFIKSAIETMYRVNPAMKGRILEYVELRIGQIEENVKEIISNRLGKS